MEVKSKQYQEHPIFEYLGYFMDFYEFLSDNVMLFLSMGTKSIINIETYMFLSMKGTLDSISCLLKIGRINDAYALLRKFYDSIYINVYATLYLQEHFDIQNFVVVKIQRWLDGSEQLPSHREISNYIRNSANLKDINALLYADKRYNMIRDRCNDNTHYNFYQNVLLNDNRVYIKNRIEHLDGLLKAITQLMIMHISYVFVLNEHYMSSSDYRDHWELGLEPPKGSENWIAFSGQEFFDQIIKKHRTDIADLIKTTSTLEIK